MFFSEVLVVGLDSVFVDVAIPDAFEFTTIGSFKSEPEAPDSAEEVDKPDFFVNRDYLDQTPFLSKVPFSFSVVIPNSSLRFVPASWSVLNILIRTSL